MPPEPEIARIATSEKSSAIEGLEWEGEQFPVAIRPKAAKNGKSVLLVGKFPREGWTLATGNRMLAPSSLSEEDGRFRFRVVLAGRTTAVDLYAVSPIGEVQKERLLIRVFPPPGKGKTGPEGFHERRFVLASAIGFSGFRYTETKHAEFTSFSLLGRLSLVYSLFPGRADLGLAVSSTLAPLVARPKTNAARFIQAGLRAGLRIPVPRDPWSLWFHFGNYFHTMVVSGNRFGFKNMMGPEARLSLRRAVVSEHSMQLRFAIVMAGAKVLNPKNRDIGVTYGLLLPRSRGGAWLVGVDVSSLALEITNAKGQLFKIRDNGAALLLGYAFGFR